MTFYTRRVADAWVVQFKPDAEPALAQTSIGDTALQKMRKSELY